METITRYPGSELETFQHARHWKAYLGTLLSPFLVGNVLEVGAGLGGTTRVLYDGRQRSWVALEPDPSLAAQLQSLAASKPFAAPLEVRTETLQTLSDDRRFDAILYIDVLEHIEHDAEELKMAATRLNEGGVLIVLSPAHPWLFSEFDQQVGHFRRYTTRSLREAAPRSLQLVQMRYLDTVGVLASAANRVLLRSAKPSLAQVRFWDAWMVPMSRVIDPIFGFRTGKSVLGIWRRQ